MPRIIELITPLGADALLFHELQGREELGRLSEFQISALSTRADISLGDILGKNVTVKLERLDGGYRYFNGYVVRFGVGGMVGRYYQYHLSVRPWLWFLTRTSDCRIFQEKTVPDIVKEVFDDHRSVAVLDDGLTAQYRKREYCVQYRETDFDFVSRLMEEEGMYYFFEHDDGRHVMHLVDAYPGHKPLDQKSIAYYPPGRQIKADEEYISAWTVAQTIQPGAVAMTDYDFTKPKADLKTRAKVTERHDQSDHEIFDYPGEYCENGDGEHYVRARVDELHAQFELADAECNVRELAVGRLFSLTNAPRRDQEREYLIVSAEYELRDNAYETVPQPTAHYHCSFQVLQSKQQFRPSRLTERPVVRGPQTAVVVGPAGEEIWCDKYSRVKVQFRWDRYGKKNENSSCWVRVATHWAGQTWGFVSIPRIGQEVIVDFLEGDPDQPIITGRVYNADQMPPYELPSNATQTGFKSRSSKGGAAANFNEIRFEDKKGSEQLYIHAERNQDIVVESSETHSVGYNRAKTIGHDETTTVKNDRTETVGGNETISIAKNRTITVAQNEVAGVLLTRTHAVGLNEMIAVGAAQEINVVGARLVTVGGAQVTTVGLHLSQIVGKNMSIEAGDEISIKTGAASIVLKKDGSIKIDGKEITISASDKIKISAQNALDMDGAQFTLKATTGQGSVNASTIVEVKGATVKINC